MNGTRRVEVDRDSLYGPENMPYGVFAPPGDDFRVGVRLGDTVLDLSVLFDDPVFACADLNLFLGAGPGWWQSIRDQLREMADTPLALDALHPIDAVRMKLPVHVGDYVDFYASLHHASTLGRLFRPDDAALLPNWRHLPVAYHGRAGTVVVSGTEVIRPHGQLRTGAQAPTFGPTQRLDIEAELGFVIGSSSSPGVPLTVDEFDEHVFGVALVNDWSARDIQAWEYQPLGPFLGKSFATSMSAWITPMAALARARVPLPTQEPQPLPYLRGTDDHGLDIELTVRCNGEILTRPPYSQMYWSPAQMLAHLTANGAAVRPGDLYASGTVSGPELAQSGSLIELSGGGTQPIRVGEEKRTFLLDGDEVTITATAPGTAGKRIGLGEVSGRIVPAYQ